MNTDPAPFFGRFLDIVKNHLIDTGYMSFMVFRKPAKMCP